MSNFNFGWTAVYYGFSWRSEQIGKVEDDRLRNHAIYQDTADC